MFLYNIFFTIDAVCVVYFYVFQLGCCFKTLLFVATKESQ